MIIVTVPEPSSFQERSSGSPIISPILSGQLTPDDEVSVEDYVCRYGGVGLQVDGCLEHVCDIHSVYQTGHIQTVLNGTCRQNQSARPRDGRIIGVTSSDMKTTGQCYNQLLTYAIRLFTIKFK